MRLNDKNSSETGLSDHDLALEQYQSAVNYYMVRTVDEQISAPVSRDAHKWTMDPNREYTWFSYAPSEPTTPDRLRSFLLDRPGARFEKDCPGNMPGIRIMLSYPKGTKSNLIRKAADHIDQTVPKAEQGKPTRNLEELVGKKGFKGQELYGAPPYEESEEDDGA